MEQQYGDWLDWLLCLGAVLFFLMPVPSLRITMFAADDESARRVWHRKPAGVFVLYVFIMFLSYWEFHIPSPGVGVAAMAVAASLMSFFGEMGGKEKLAWTALLFAFLHLELTSIRTERTANEESRRMAVARETLEFTNVRKGIENSNERAERRYQATTQQLGNLTKLQERAISKLRPLGEALTQQLALMPPKELIETAQAIAKQMKLYEQKYVYADADLDLPYDSQRASARFSDKELQRLQRQEEQKRTQLCLDYERDASGMIAKANAVRKEILNRLSLSEKSSNDEKRGVWFEHPAEGVSSPTHTFLFKLLENADYLQNLASRLATSTQTD